MSPITDFFQIEQKHVRYRLHSIRLMSAHFMQNVPSTKNPPHGGFLMQFKRLRLS
jgi:hypothetical protein